MKVGASQGQPASELISKRIAELDWRETFRRMRKLIRNQTAVVEEWKWMGTPIWSHDASSALVNPTRMSKLTAKGASLKDPPVSTRVSTETYAARSTYTKEKN
jgi:hypothetical protein